MWQQGFIIGNKTMEANNNFTFLAESYLFPEVGRRVRNYKSTHPESEIIRMDVGDVTLPIIGPVVEAMKKAVEEMADAKKFHGYGPEQGYDFLREAIAKGDYKERGVAIEPDEIFISDGAKSDIGNLTDIFDRNCIVGIPDPVYPVYVDSNIMAGRTVENGRIVYITCDPEEDYKPLIPTLHTDIVYLCSPNNPTGSVLSREDLQKWVDYAVDNQALIIFDSAYESFVTDPSIPRSIYEIKGAEKVAIEVRSFSKTAGFTGLRCGYTVVPKALKARFANGTEVELRKLWLRRQTTKFNGAGYITQRGAEAIYLPEGKEAVMSNIRYYLRNAGLLRNSLENMGIKVVGGINSPYVWFSNPFGLDSWKMFDLLLDKCNISSTPGSGFGKGGEGCIRLTGFNSYQNTLLAAERLRNLIV